MAAECAVAVRSRFLKRDRGAFVAVDAATTQVELEHRGLEAFGAQAAQMRDVLGSANGWGGMLDHYAVVTSR